VRYLLQRRTDGTWWSAPPVARASRDDWVATNSTGAEVLPAGEIHSAAELARCREVARGVCRALDEPGLVELGIDVAIDPEGAPWILEVNTQPRGRLEQLAQRNPERFAADHQAILERPLRYLAARFA
jgi:hypothetical protein